MPSADVFEGTEPEIIPNEESAVAEPAQPTISEENEYSIDLGGANEENAPANPVLPNEEAQAAADNGEIPIEEAPGPEDVGGSELDDNLSELGIN